MKPFRLYGERLQGTRNALLDFDNDLSQRWAVDISVPTRVLNEIVKSSMPCRGCIYKKATTPRMIYEQTKRVEG